MTEEATLEAVEEPSVEADALLAGETAGTDSWETDPGVSEVDAETGATGDVTSVGDATSVGDVTSAGDVVSVGDATSVGDVTSEGIIAGTDVDSDVSESEASDVADWVGQTVVFKVTKVCVLVHGQFVTVIVVGAVAVYVTPPSTKDVALGQYVV